MAVASTTSNFERDAKNAITSNIRQLNNAISVDDAVFRAIVLSSVECSLITEYSSKEILETDKTPLGEKATKFIYSILGVVGSNHKHLDTFLLILHDEGGITGSEIAEKIAKDYGHDLPKYKAAVLTVNKVPMAQVLINDNESTGKVTMDSSASSVSTTEQLPNIAVQAEIPSHIGPECLQMKFNDDLLVSLALKNHKVEDVARYFGMEDYLSQIEESKSDSSKIVSILSMWRKMKEGDATYLAIIEILVQNGRTEVAKSIAISVHKRYSTLSHFHDNDESAFKPELSYPNWNDLDKSQQEIIKNDLKNENVTIVSLFCDIFMDSLESMDKQPTVNFRHIRLFLKKEHENQLTSESLIDLKQINDVTGIFEFMDDVGCNWFNFTLLDKFMSRYGSDEDKQRVYDYAVKLWDYLQRSLYRIPPESFGPSQIPPDQTYHFLLLLVDGKDITANGQHVKWVQSKLAEELKISLDSIKIKIELGSIIIHFIVNKKLFIIDDERFALFAKHEKIENIYYIDVDWLKYFPYNNETLPKEMCLCGYIDDPFSCLLQEYSGRLSQITLPSEIVHLLYTEGVIDKETFDRVESSEGCLINESFKALRSAVYLDHNKLRVFASVLLRLEDTVPIANNILQEPLISGLVNPILKWTFPRNDSVSNLPFLIKSKDSDDSLSSLLDEFISFINSVIPLIAGGFSSLDGLKSFLGRAYAEMRPQLAHAWSIIDVLILVIENCSLINVSCLEAVINNSNIEPAQAQLSNYIIKVKEFCSNTTCSQCVEMSFRVFSSHLLICDTVQFTLYPNKVADETLNDIRSLMDDSFGYLAKKVDIESIIIIEKLVAVSCYVPHYITNSLQSEKSCNKKIMTAKILIFSIAGNILWDHSTPVINADIIPIKGEVTDKSTHSDDSDNNRLRESQRLASIYLKKYEQLKKEIGEDKDISILDSKVESAIADHESSPLSSLPDIIVPDTVEVTGENLDEDGLQCYFEGECSGGGREKTVESIKTISSNVMHVKFSSIEDAAVVVNHKQHVYLKKPITVQYVVAPPPIQYEKDQLLIKNIPEGVDEEFLVMFIESRCSELESEANFSIDFRSNCALLKLSHDYSNDEFTEMIKKLTSKKIKNIQFLTVERVEVTCSLVISNITNEAFLTEDGLELYFETPHSGSQAGAVKKIELSLGNKFVITFTDSSVVSQVLKQKHERLGPNVMMASLTMFDMNENSNISQINSDSTSMSLTNNTEEKGTLETKQITIAGHINAATKLQGEINEISSQLLAKSDNVSINEEDYIFLKSLGSSVVKSKHPNVELHFDDSNQTVTLVGSIRDVDELKLKLDEEYLIHSKVRVNVSPLAKSLLQSFTGRSIIQNLSHSFNVIPYFCDDSLMLLSKNEFASQAETVASEIANEVSTCSIALPQSFHSTVDASLLDSFQGNLKNSYHFHYSVTQHQLTIVSTIDVIKDVKDAFATFINEKCSVTKVIYLSKGAWCLFNTKMKKSWSDIVNDMEKRNVTIESQSKPTAQNPSIKLKGENHHVEAITEKISALQSSVKMLQVSISCPGIRQFFTDSSNGQMILRGVEKEAKVCLVLEEVIEQTEATTFANLNQHFFRVCFGSTLSGESIDRTVLPKFIKITKGNILEHQEEASVNSTNFNFGFEGYVSQVLSRSAGPGLLEESQTITKSLPLGSIVTTSGHNLKSNYIIHVVLPGYDRGYSEQVLRETVQKCLAECDRLRIKSISIPSIGAGRLNYPENIVASALIEEAVSYLEKHQYTSLQLVHFVLYEQEVYDAFQKCYSSMNAPTADIFQHATLEETDDDFNQEFKHSTVLPLESKIVICIYGETDHLVKKADRRLKISLEEQFINEYIHDENISFLSDSTVKDFEMLASNKDVEIDIDCDPALNTIKLCGTVQNVLFVKDKIHEKIFKTAELAASALNKKVHWTRQESNEEEEDYGKDLSCEIEQSYQNEQISFMCRKEGFSINFEKMEETDIKTGKNATVRRVDLSKETIPDNWDPMPIDSKGKEKQVHCVSLTAGSAEYNRVETNFDKTMQKGKSYNEIISIQCIQNPALYQQYVVKKKEMDRLNPKDHENEKWLWHGTNVEALEQINTRGFDRGYAGAHVGSHFGSGVYFAPDAIYSDHYAKPDANGHRHMYCCQVLTGEYTAGTYGMVVPPPKNPQVDNNVRFDSTVDNQENPAIFVVYLDCQYYPTYLISYK